MAEVWPEISDWMWQGEETMSWSWQAGDFGHYWGYTVLPSRANVSMCMITQLFFTTDNSDGYGGGYPNTIFNATANITVQALNSDGSPGVYLKFTAIRSP